MVEVVSTDRNKIHPHKFTLWVAIGSIVMMFAGLTSAFIVKGSLPGWTTTEIPAVFWISTLTMIGSSVTIQLAQKSFKERRMQVYRRMITLTAILGLLFVVLQVAGFYQLHDKGYLLTGATGAAQFLYIIFGLHALHVLGGIIALAVMFAKAFSSRSRNYNPVSIEIASTYWHFVDALWLYLFIFFLWSR